MIRSLFKLAFLAIAAILVYNYLFGTSEEKENSREVFGKMKGVVVSVADLVKSERAKFDAGKYDAALEKLGGAYKAIRQQAQHVDGKVLQRLDELEKRKSALEQELDTIQQGDQQADAAPQPAPGKRALKPDPKAEQERVAKAADQTRRKEALQRELESLLHDSETLLQDAQQ